MILKWRDTGIYPEFNNTVDFKVQYADSPFQIHPDKYRDSGGSDISV